jgi:protein TonB
LAEQDANQETKRQPSAWRLLQRHSGKLVVAALLISLLLHAVSFVELGKLPPSSPLDFSHQKKNTVKFKVVQVPKKEPPKKKEEPPKPEPDLLPKILEMPQTKTQPPDQADYVGTVDHQTKKETRISDKLKREKAKDAGQKGKPETKVEAPVVQNKPDQPKPQQQKAPPPPVNPSDIKNKVGKLSMDAYKPKPRNDYEALLPTSINDLPGQVEAGYQDYVDDKVDEGDRIDINTTEYRYIGYFTNMRKAIELVWNYPLDAARKGEQGEVGLEFAITKDGHATSIRVIKSSGYEILDRAIVEAIKLASPFAPLPEGFKKTRLVVTGSFRYILSSYGSH